LSEDFTRSLFGSVAVSSLGSFWPYKYEQLSQTWLHQGQGRLFEGRRQ
jgi:hypothetical protein